ncbi:hypothetical protein Ancab_002736 [Ancistrocladus abbreviatus]
MARDSECTERDFLNGDGHGTTVRATFVSVIFACAHLRGIVVGKSVHGFLTKETSWTSYGFCLFLNHCWIYMRRKLWELNVIRHCYYHITSMDTGQRLLDERVRRKDAQNEEFSAMCRLMENSTRCNCSVRPWNSSTFIMSSWLYGLLFPPYGSARIPIFKAFHETDDDCIWSAFKTLFSGETENVDEIKKLHMSTVQFIDGVLTHQTSPGHHEHGANRIYMPRVKESNDNSSVLLTEMREAK